MQPKEADLKLIDKHFIRSFVLEYGFLDDGKIWMMPPDGYIFQVDKLTLTILLDLNAGKSVREAAEKYGIGADQIEFLVRKLNEHGGITAENFGRIKRSSAREDTDIAGYTVLLFIMSALQAYYFTFFARTFLMNKISEGITVAAIALLAIIFHEAGHFLFTWNFTGLIPKAGFGMSFIFPIVYVDTQASWRLPRNKRLIINSGGLFFDSLVNTLAVLAAFSYPALEYYVTPFLLTQYTRWSILLNPIFRGDGYWILSDMFGIVNLGKRGMEALKKLKFNLFSLFGIVSVAFSVLSAIGLIWFIFGLAGSAVTFVINILKKIRFAK